MRKVFPDSYKGDVWIHTDIRSKGFRRWEIGKRARTPSKIEITRSGDIGDWRGAERDLVEVRISESDTANTFDGRCLRRRRRFRDRAG